MKTATLIVTYNRLDITEREVQNLFGQDENRSFYPVIDGVDGMKAGKGMTMNMIYHFGCIGSSAICTPVEHIQKLYDRLTKQEANYTIGNDPTRYYYPDVSSVAIQATENGSESSKVISNGIYDEGDDIINVKTIDPEWNLKVIKAIGLQQKGKGVKIAILDSGITYHDDLNICGGESFVEGHVDPYEDVAGHGTQCAGVAAGKNTGVAPEAKLYAVKIYHSSHSELNVILDIPVPSILAGMCWALKNDMDIVSLSIASSDGTTAFIDSYAKAVQALMNNGCVVLASVGDTDPFSDVGQPANTPGIIAVGSYGQDGVTNFSNRGGPANQVTVVAPAEFIMTTSSLGTGQYIKNFDGSSAACPHVTGLVALLFEKYPYITPLQIISKIMISATHLAGDISWGIESGAGLINCEEALKDQDPLPSSKSNKLMQNTQAPSSTLMDVAPKYYATASLAVTLKVSSDPPGRWFFVAIINCDAHFLESRRVQKTDTNDILKVEQFKDIPLGRYYVIAIREGDKRAAKKIVFVAKGKNKEKDDCKEGDTDNGCYQVQIDMSADPSGKITAYVFSNGMGSPGRIVTVEGINVTHYETLMTDGTGMALSGDLDDKMQYKITANCFPFSPKDEVHDGTESELHFFFP